MLRTQLHRLLVVVFLLALGFDTGCNPPPPKTRFNRRIVSTTKQLSEAAAAFRKALEPLEQGKDISPGTVQGAFRTVEKSVADAREKYEDAILPLNSDSAVAYLDAFKDFLKTEESIVQTNLKKALTIGLQSDQDRKSRWAEIQAEFQAADAAESSALSKLMKAQQAFADEHNYKLDKHAD
jgi:hypothetical protein